MLGGRRSQHNTSRLLLLRRAAAEKTRWRRLLNVRDLSSDIPETKKEVGAD
jgi:hypothetical protein